MSSRVRTEPVVESSNRSEPLATGLEGEGNAALAERVMAETVAETAATPVLDAAPAKVIPGGELGDVYRKHDAAIPGMDPKATSEHKWAIEHFKKTYAKNAERYAAVSAKTNMPAELIAALHYRESSMDFGTYLHQGDPLGKKAVNTPSNIPIFNKWEDGAVHALGQKSSVQKALGIEADTTDPAALATYAERYNGLGYHRRDTPSPYVYAGTDVYKGGKYVKDGKYDGRVWDSQPGVMALMGSLKGEDGETPDWANPQEPEEAWGAVAAGDVRVREGQRGPAVEAVQGRLAAAGFDVGADGDFGPKTQKALMAFQRAHGLKADGVVGPATAAALESAGGLKAPAEAAPDTSGPQPTENAPSEPAAVKPPADDWKKSIAAVGNLSRGSKGEPVSEVQRRLANAGFSVGVDGDFGPKTREAVKAFQKAHGLTPDGVLGPKTLAAL